MTTRLLTPFLAATIASLRLHADFQTFDRCAGPGCRQLYGPSAHHTPLQALILPDRVKGLQPWCLWLPSCDQVRERKRSRGNKWKTEGKYARETLKEVKTVTCCSKQARGHGVTGNDDLKQFDNSEVRQDSSRH